ncbi:hypothetical protein FB451DRAFT_1272996 [Mycena latifolia]|nr:hypothetical protein FB451DRAFT_1272996 [Mycena latifolia]
MLFISTAVAVLSLALASRAQAIESSCLTCPGPVVLTTAPVPGASVCCYYGPGEVCCFAGSTGQLMFQTGIQCPGSTTVSINTCFPALF